MLRLREVLPAQAAVYSIAQPELPPPNTPILVFDAVDPDAGLLLEDLELLLLHARLQLPNTYLGLHLTYWPAAFAYGTEWGLDFFLCHEPTFQAVQGYAPEGPFLDRIADWAPPPPWKLLSPAYRPTLAQVARLNAFLQMLTSLRKAVPIQPQQSTLLRTQGLTQAYLHLSLSDLQAHVAALRR